MINRLLLFSLAATAISFLGCGGAGNSLTGGSVPIGGRSIAGVALLPDSTPAANAQVQLIALPSSTTVAVTTTDAQGRFTVSGVSTTSDLDIVITIPPSNILETVVPQASLASPGGGVLNIGSVTAITSVVAAAIKLEQMNAPGDENSIVGNQIPGLTNEVDNDHYSQQEQQQLISNRNSINAQALALMVPVANSEIAAMYQNPTRDTAAEALNGILGYLRAAHNRNFMLSQNMKQALITAQVARTEYSAAAVAAALQQAGLSQVTATEVLAASARETTELSAFPSSLGGIPPFEALVIAADVGTNGGFECNQQALNSFLNNLLVN